jgi:hypothetical protein
MKYKKKRKKISKKSKLYIKANKHGGKKMKTDYQKQANDFLKKTGTTYKATFIKNDLYFTDDKEPRDIWRITLKRNGKRWSFRFGNSINASQTNEAPTAYDVLATLTKYDVGSFNDFCFDFGYDTDSRKAEKIYKAVVKEFEHVDKMFSDVINELAEIN